MCGVCGIFHYGSGDAPDPAVLGAMNDALTHRGPDEAGSHIEGAVGLAMRRLMIIDPETGQQPFQNEDNSVTLVFNGEIYNFRELRDELIGRGHTLRSRGDGEVIVHLYEEMGIMCLERLRGMFAFALWDNRSGELYLARDRLGIKPLYFADVGGTLAFASEAKSILQWPGFERRVDGEGLHHYLSLNCVPAPFTLFEGMAQLEPGEFLTCGPAGVEKHAYWDLNFLPDETVGEDEWARRVRDKLEECVTSHLVSDVPFGAFLSGGIDSSAVVSFMAEALDQPVSTFTIDFAEKGFSEAGYARSLAALRGADHHEKTVSPDVVNLMETLIWHADDPLADSSMIPLYIVSEFAREHVTMVLTGDGGDELFAGYNTYNAHFVRARYRRLPSWLRKGVISPLVNALPVTHSNVSFDFKAKRFVRGAEQSDEDAHFWWRVIFDEQAKEALYAAEQQQATRDFETAQVFREQFERSGTDDALSRLLYVDTRLSLPADMLTKVDRMSMAHGLEARVPFLDHELVELAARIPSSLKFKGETQKYILKRALHGVVPDETLNRRKAGFNVPVNTWLTGQLRAFADQVLARDRIAAAGLLDPDAVGRLTAEHRARRADRSYQIWSLICLQIWYERFIGCDEVRAPEAVARRWD